MTGRGRGSAPDVKHPLWAIEAKCRKKLPAFAFLTDAMDQAIRSVRGDQIPVVIMHQKGQRTNDDMVVMRFGDFAKLNQQLMD